MSLHISLLPATLPISFTRCNKTAAERKVLLRKKFTQKQLITFTANMQTCLIGMEACSGAHFLGRA
jgi:hypothetical protein